MPILSPQQEETFSAHIEAYVNAQYEYKTAANRYKAIKGEPQGTLASKEEMRSAADTDFKSKIETEDDFNSVIQIIQNKVRELVTNKATVDVAIRTKQQRDAALAEYQKLKQTTRHDSKP